MLIIIDGLPGAGKSTAAKILARKITALFFDADGLRPTENISGAGERRQAGYAKN